MAEMAGSALVRRHLGRRLTELRKVAALSRADAAKAIDRGESTLARMENGEESVRYRALEITALMKLYRASDEDADELLALAVETSNGKKKSWWHDYTESTLPSFFGPFVSLEDSCEQIRTYEVEVVPGLLQTRAYAEHVHRVPTGYIGEDEIERRVEVRLRRQSLLTRTKPRAPQMSVILSDAAIRRRVGGSRVMAEQLQHLLDATQQYGISVRILPYTAGAHGGMAASTPFTILDFPQLGSQSKEPLEPPLVYVDTMTGALYLNKTEEVAAYELVWKDLESRVLDNEKSAAVITKELKELSSG